jgi:periodic tryptophan protein 1
MAGMILAMCWVPRGAAKTLPTVYKASEEEMRGMLGSMSLNGKTGGGGEEEEEAEVEDEISKKYNLDDYDDEGGGVLGVAEDVVFQKNEDDPYITVRDEEDTDDLDDFTIRTTDALLITGTAEDDYSHLDVHIYEEPDDNLYVHHDIMLPTYPLSIAWTDSLPGRVQGKGSFVAIGTFDPAIEIWDLDVVDALQPTAVLGGLVNEEAPQHPSKARKQRRKQKPQLRTGSHTGAVLGLAFNRHQRHVLASCSEDATIKLWDVGRAECLQTYGYHKDKVQAVRWHCEESSVLASGAFDRQLCILDVRHQTPATSWTLTADVESLEWNPHAPNQLLVSTEDGMVSCYSVEAGAKPLWSFQAHDKSVSAITFSPGLPNLLATISTDKTFKLWDLSAPAPRCLASTETSLGKLFCGSFFEDSPYLLAVGGKKGLKIYNTYEMEGIRQRFGQTSASAPVVTTE